MRWCCTSRFRFTWFLEPLGLLHSVTMLSLLLSMPNDVIRGRIAPFFDLLSLVKLDSATLSKQHRSNLLNYVLREAVLLEGDIRYEKRLFDWFIMRGVHIVDVQFPSNSEPADVVHATPVLCTTHCVVNITGCLSLTNECIQNFAKNCKSGLQMLVFNSCPWVTDETLQIVADLHGASITIFDIGRCTLVTDAGAAYVANKCDDLEDVKWDFCDQIGTLAVAALASHRLVTFSINSCPSITEDSLVEFLQGNEDYLEILQIEGNNQLTDRTLLAVAENCPSLEFFEMCENDSFSDTGFSAIVESCQLLIKFQADFNGTSAAVLDLMGLQISPELEILIMGMCLHCTDAHVAAITTRASKLNHIRIAESDLITDRALCSIGANVHGLTIISIQICNNVGYEGIEALVRGCPLLTEIHLGMCPKVCDRCLDAIATHSKQLRDLAVTDSDVITDKGVRKIAKMCTLLAFVNFDFTKISDLAVKYLINNCSQLSTISLGGRGAVSPSLQKLADRRKIDLVLSEPDE